MSITKTIKVQKKFPIHYAKSSMKLMMEEQGWYLVNKTEENAIFEFRKL